MVELRLRTRIAAAELEAKQGRIVTDRDYNLLLTGPARVLLPTGQPLCVYLPGVMPEELRTEAYSVLRTVRQASDNRGMASGSDWVMVKKQRRNRKVMSAILGAYERTSGRHRMCRLTGWTGSHAAQFAQLQPYFAAVAGHFARHVPDRYAAQMERVRATNPAWVIPGTPYSTVTVNNTYPTGIHQDAGDLPEGFSCLTTLRRGSYTGGRLVFAEYRVAADMQDGDVMLMDAHAWHGNTALVCSCGTNLEDRCEECGAERISTVLYYRTRMAQCGTPEEEVAHARSIGKLHELLSTGEEVPA